VTEPPARPVFVVGAPRSGTTLLAAMLAAHPAFDCGPETHLLWHWSQLGRRRREGLLDRRAWPDAAARWVCGLRMGGRPVHDMVGIEADAVRDWLARRAPSLAALLESLTAQRAERARKPRWVEKTPRHLEVPWLIERTWPAARVVRIVRDPRDAAVSLTRVPFGAESMVTNLALLARLDERSAAFFRTSPAALTLRYEDLVREPERELRRVCDAVGVAFDPLMLDERARSADLAASHEWWKTDVTRPLDPSRAGGWHTAMPEPVQRYAALNLAGFLAEHGYEGARDAARRLAIVPAADSLAARHEAMLLRLAASDVAVARPVPRGVRDLARHRDLVFFGVAGQLDPVPDATPARRAWSITALGALLAWRRLVGRPVAWVPRLSLLRRRSRDPGERVVARLLRLFAQRIEADAIPGLVGLAGDEAPRR
jgi:hypothetical protein